MNAPNSSIRFVWGSLNQSSAAGCTSVTGAIPASTLLKMLSSVTGSGSGSAVGTSEGASASSVLGSASVGVSSVGSVGVRISPPSEGSWSPRGRMMICDSVGAVSLPKRSRLKLKATPATTPKIAAAAMTPSTVNRIFFTFFFGTIRSRMNERSFLSSFLSMFR